MNEDIVLKLCIAYLKSTMQRCMNFQLKLFLKNWLVTIGLKQFKRFNDFTKYQSFFSLTHGYHCGRSVVYILYAHADLLKRK